MRGISDILSASALRCQSESCYTEVYLPEELEPGEIDVQRQRQFQTCMTTEQRNERLNKNKQRRGGGAQAAAEPATADASDGGADEDGEAPTDGDQTGEATAAVEL